MKTVLLGPLAMLALLAGCDASGLMNQAMTRTAESVVTPVIGPDAARCVMDNASSQEAQALARDVGVVAGTTTRANIAAILARPATQDCLARQGIAQPRI